MRFKEFKILLEETGKFYTIGDSHAVAVATVGGKNWVNLAIGGKSSTDSAMLANIAKIPKGATVLVSQGANDTANAMRASMESKKPPRDPNQIAANVANVVSKVEAQGAKVIFMLFPNGPGRGAGLAKYYGGDYQEEVRNAIKKAISVPIIDINGKPLTDGVHATMSVYKEVANQVAAGGSSRDSSSEVVKPTAPKQSGKQLGTIQVPANLSEKSDEIKQIQTALITLGYPLPKYGEDGIFGPETAGAVRRFQKDNSLKIDGDPGPETVGKLNELLKTAPVVAQSGKSDGIVTVSDTSPAGARSLGRVSIVGGKPVELPSRSSRTAPPTSAAPTQSGKIAPTTSSTAPDTSTPKSKSNRVSPAQIVSYLKSKGLSANHIVGILANIEAESSFDSGILGDGGTSGGLFQHHDGFDVNRFTLMRKAAGPDWQTNWKGQIDFALSESEGQQYLSKQFRTPEEATRWFTIYFEIPQNKDYKAAQRSQNLDRFIRLV